MKSILCVQSDFERRPRTMASRENPSNFANFLHSSETSLCSMFKAERFASPHLSCAWQQQLG